MSMSATYSPDDNKLRLYSTTRLDAGTYERVKAAGFRWAPKQELFFATWTPGAEDLLLELCEDGIGDEDTSLVQRAEERADRFEGYSENRAREATQARNAVQAIGQRFEFGQPILVGHHSERKARKDAERMESGMRKAVKAWETSGYWQDRAQGALAHAKYLERPDVRARRIKTIEADKRKQERHKAEAERWLRGWSKEGLTMEQAQALANVCRLHMPRIEGDRPDFNQQPSAYDALHNTYPNLYAPRTLEQVVERAKKVYPAQIAWAERWIAHYDNRLAYERAMLGQTGGIVADLVEGRQQIEVGGRVLVRGEWMTVMRVNKKDGKVVSVRTNCRFVPVRGVDEVAGYEPPTAEAAELVKKATKLAPLCNFPGEGFLEMTAAEWAKKPGDYKAVKHCKANEAHGAYRYRSAFVPGGSYRTAQVFITDQKRVDPPAPGAEVVRVPAPEQVVRAPRPAAEPVASERAQVDAEMQAVKQQLKQGVAVQVVNAPQLFPTPPDLARRMVALAGVEPGERVLEPSAGTGRLLDALPGGCEVVAVELNGTLAGHLHRADRRVLGMDFMECTAELLGGQFDVVLMNPPFAKAADIAHIQHALRMLKHGGRLVAICAGGPRQAQALRPTVESLGGTWEPLPAGTFKDEGTGVHSVLLALTMPPGPAEPEKAPQAAQVAPRAAQALQGVEVAPDGPQDEPEALEAIAPASEGQNCLF